MWALVDGRRPGSFGTAALDGAAGKAVLAAGGASKDAGLVVTGGVRGRCALSARGRQRRGTGGTPSRARRYRSPPGYQGCPRPPDRRERERDRSKRVARRQARHGPARLEGFAPRGRAPRKREATPGIERSWQVHVNWSELQKSVRSTLPVHGRGHREMLTGLRGSVRRRPSVVGRRRALIAAREEVPGGAARSDTFARGLPPRSRDRGPTRWKASWVVRLRALNKRGVGAPR